MAMPPKLPAVDKVDSMKLIALQTPSRARQPPTPVQLAVLERSRLRQHETAQTHLQKQETVSANMREAALQDFAAEQHSRAVENGRLCFENVDIADSTTFQSTLILRCN